MSDKTSRAPRCAALIGPYLSGKTTLLESLLHSAGIVHRKGSVRDGTALGDTFAEARKRQMSTEVNIAQGVFLGDAWTFIDCPGSIELVQAGRDALRVADIAVVVTEADPEKALMLAPYLHMLDEMDLPHILFFNKIDNNYNGIKAMFEAVQDISVRPPVLREIPIRQGDAVAGYVDLVSERAFKWRDGAPSDLISMPTIVAAREESAREEMLETLADFDDALLTELLEDVTPSPAEIYDNLARDLARDVVVPVFFGSGEHDHGVKRLLKALRHETPEPDVRARRLNVSEAANATPLVQVFKTVHSGQGGKVSMARVWRGEILDGASLGGDRISGVWSVMGAKMLKKDGPAVVGDVVGLGRLEGARTGDILTSSGGMAQTDALSPLEPVYALALRPANPGDDVKLTAALGLLCAEDAALRVVAEASTGELLLQGQGDVHLAIALDTLGDRFGLKIEATRPRVPYKETVRKSVTRHARHRKQSGGHGEFGDITVEIAPLPRGGGFAFDERISGGRVPKKYIPAVENGVIEALRKGPLGFPVVDLSVVLVDGQHHEVDSSDMAFRKAAGLALREGLNACDPVLLEPICRVVIAAPSRYSSNVQRVVSARRGQILSFNARESWSGWDEIEAYIPQANLDDLIVDVRSQTVGVGTLRQKFDHHQELVGRLADEACQEQGRA
ncbi:elongation factor G [Varunaivibrio sulfuroxidans]|uniref:Elongation factor G n=1 Tax=Varunaivibrio sulfuroxidans TaxID=1773489 RepID=A0A4R3JCT5_9PROT|nr:elongation factor G [Varunaivibrio sulfuroxidans]TCS63582.1 translation elongation factor 2 (EF-2/EF-G) [Varunaivibrio sulfuroxidans]WES30275.1 elongation factor G [Varunaivibrio sulfuroxidans]